MRKRTRVIVLSAVAVGAVAVGGGIAVAAGGGDEGDQHLTGQTLDRASQAALAKTGGGTVNEAEIGDEGDAYEVEVRLPDGTTTDVSLDANFQVIGQESDTDSANGGADDSSGDTANDN